MTSTRRGRTDQKAEKEEEDSRGKSLSKMVKFDPVSYEILHLDSYEYEKYIAVMFATKLFQATTQTKDDGLEEGVQTEVEERRSKWTQCPPKWTRMSFNGNRKEAGEEILGVGGDEEPEDDKTSTKESEDGRSGSNLSKFMSKAGGLMLSVLEYKRRAGGLLGGQGGSRRSRSSSSGLFADHRVIFDRGLPVMRNLKMHAVTAAGELVACANGQEETWSTSPNGIDGSRRAGLGKKNLVTVWSLKEPSMPLYFLRVWGSVNVLKVHPLLHLVVSGNRDGSLNFWSLKESSQYHTAYQEKVIRTPSVNTSCMPDPNHALPVQGVEILQETKNSALVVSVDKEKYIICWSCLTVGELKESGGSGSGSSTAINHSTWSRIRVSKRNVISLESVFATPAMTVTSLHVWRNESANFVIGTNAGFIGIGTLAGGEVGGVYQKCGIGPNVVLRVTSVHRNGLMGLIAGSCDDQHVRLFDLRRKRAILALECGGGGGEAGGGGGVPARVCWSSVRECLLYVATAERLEAWDLLTSDLAPVKVVQLPGLKDVAVFPWGDQELIAAITATEIAVFPLLADVKGMEDKEKIRFRRYISII